MQQHLEVDKQVEHELHPLPRVGSDKATGRWGKAGSRESGGARNGLTAR